MIGMSKMADMVAGGFPTRLQTLWGAFKVGPLELGTGAGVGFELKTLLGSGSASDYFCLFDQAHPEYDIFLLNTLVIPYYCNVGSGRVGRVHARSYSRDGGFSFWVWAHSYCKSFGFGMLLLKGMKYNHSNNRF